MLFSGKPRALGWEVRSSLVDTLHSYHSSHTRKLISRIWDADVLYEVQVLLEVKSQNPTENHGRAGRRHGIPSRALCFRVGGLVD